MHQRSEAHDESIRSVLYSSQYGFLHFQTNLFLWELGGPAIAAITAAIDNAPATCKVIIVPLRGAISRVSLNDMAFALRQPGYEVDIAGVWSAPAEKGGACTMSPRYAR